MADHPSILEVFSNSTNSWSVGLVVDSQEDKFMVRFLDPEGVARQKVASRSDPQFARFGEYTRRTLPPSFLEVPSNSRPGQFSFYDPVAKRKVGSIELAWKIYLERRLLDDQLQAVGGIPTTYGTGPGTPRAGGGRSAAYTVGYGERPADVATAQEVPATPSAWSAPLRPQFAVAQQCDGWPYVPLRRAEQSGEIIWEIPNGTMVRLLGPSAGEHVEISVHHDQQMIRGWVKRHHLQVHTLDFQSEVDNAEDGAAPAYPSYAEMSSNFTTAQASTMKPSILQSSLRPESGIFGYTEVLDKKAGAVGVALWEPQEAIRAPRATPDVEPMMTSYGEAPRPAPPVTRFKKDEKSQIFEPVVTELISETPKPVGMDSEKHTESVENPEVRPLPLRRVFSSYDQDQAINHQEVHLPSQPQQGVQRQSIGYEEVQLSDLSVPTSPSQTVKDPGMQASYPLAHAMQRHIVDNGSHEVQQSSSSTAPPSTPLSDPAQLAVREHTQQKGESLSTGPRRSSVDEWVASYMHMPVEKTQGLMYFNRIPVNYTQFVELLMPVAYVNEDHRHRIIQEIESGAVMNTSLDLFTRSHVDTQGNLHWQDAGITNFVTWVFHAHNIGAPTHDLIQPLYEVLDVDKNGYLSVWEALCLVDALLRATFMKEFVMPEPPPDEEDA